MKIQSIVVLMFGFLLSGRMPAPGQSEQGMSISIEAHKRALVHGEPLYLTDRIQNNGQQPIVLVYGNGPSYDLGQGLGRILIGKGDEKQDVWSDQLRPLEKVSPIVIPAGQVITNEYVILYSHPNGFAFPTAGDYRVSTEYVLKSGQLLRATPSSITIREPVGEDARQWETLQKETGYGILLQTPWDSRADSSALSRLISIYNRGGQSVYKQYLGLAIGRCYYTDGSDINRQKAVAFLQSASASADTEVMQKKALHAISCR